MPRDDASSGVDPRPKPWRRAPFAAVAAAFIAGILVSHWLAAPLWLWAGLAGLGLCAAAAALLLTRLRRAALPGLLLGFLAAGGADHYLLYYHLPPGHVAEVAADERVLVKLRGTVCSEVVSTQKIPLVAEGVDGTWNWETAFDVRARALLTESGERPLRGLVKVKLTGLNPGLDCGDEAELVGELQTPNLPTNPGQFDYREYLRRQGFRAILYVSGEGGARVTRPGGPSPRRWLYAVRRRLVAMVDPSRGGRGAKVLAVMLLGATEALPPDMVESFQQSGGMHLLSISGLHVAMIAGVVWWLVRLVRAPAPVKSLAVIGCVVLYVLVTGSRPPAVRAGIMIVLIELAGALSRRQISINSIALAALIILAFSPCELFMIGFQLSFLAILAILYLYRPIRDTLERLRSPLETLQDRELWPLWLRALVGLRGLAAPLIAMSLAASLGVLPLIAWTFHIVSPWSVLANVMLVPLAWLGVTLGFAGFAVALPLSAVWAGAGVLLKPAVGASWVLERAAAGAASVPGAFYYTAGPPAWLLAAWYAGLAAFVHRERLGLTPRRLGVGALALANAFVFDAILPGPRRLEATCFDVRHGSCVLLRFPSGETLLYDCGTTGALFDVGAYVAAPALWEMGIRRIDALVLSHPDADHINGVISLAKRFRIGRAFVSPYFGSEPVGKFHIGKLREAGVEVAELAAGDGFSLGDAEVRVLGPPRGRLRIGRDANNRSLVVRVECRGRSFLLPGDVEDSGTAWLLSCGPAIRSDVLLMPHHGALQEQSRELVDAVRPAMAIISSGRGETEPAMIELLREAGCEVLQTGERGAISVTAEDGGLRAAGFAR